MQPSRGSSIRGRPYTRTPTRGTSHRGNGRGTSGQPQAVQPSPTTGARGAFRSRDKRGRGAPNSRGGLPKQLVSGAVGAGSSPAVRGQRGRGAFSKVVNNASQSSIHSESQSRITHPDHIEPIDLEKIAERRERLKVSYDAERKRCIQQGLIADPSKRTTLENAITPVGRCTDMCDEKERVDRIFEMNGDPAEQLPNSVDGKSTIIESRMVKKFRRAAAGVEEQMPLEIRTPPTLKRTLDYLLDEIFAKHRLAEYHKFIWDRTRAIRNDFSIQQVTKEEDVKLAVDCFERIARFHILALHQLSNPDNLEEDEHFEAHQEREQLNNTLLSLMYYYDDHRDRIDFANEAEFKAYSILFEIRSPTPDLENRVQSWPRHILCDGRVQTALQLYMAAGDPYHKSGPLRPDTEAVVSQAKSGRVWDLLRSSRVSYLMACVAEINFATVRFTALKCLCEAYYNAPKPNLAKITTWTKPKMLEYLAFDAEDEAEEFCADFEMHFVSAPAPGSEDYLDFTAAENMRSYRTPPKQKQVFSHSLVEMKRFHRTLTAVINGISVADALRQNLVVETEVQSTEPAVSATRSDLFVHDDDDEDKEDDAQGDELEPTPDSQQQPPSKPIFNPLAASFTPFNTPPASGLEQTSVNEPRWKTNFGGGGGVSATDVPKGIFGQQNKQKQEIEQPGVSASTPAFTNPFTTQPNPTANPFNKSNDSSTTTPAFNFQRPESDSESIFKPAAAPQALQKSTSVFRDPAIPAAVAVTSFAPIEKPSIPSTDTATIFQPSTTILQSLATEKISSLPSSLTQTESKAFASVTSDSPSEQQSKPPISFPSVFPTSPSITSAPTAPPPTVPGPRQLSSGIRADQTGSQVGSASLGTTSAVNPDPTPKLLSPEPFSFQPVNPQDISSTTLAPKSPTPSSFSRASSQPTLTAAQLLDVAQQKSLEENRKELITSMVRIGLTQKDGILDMFLGVKISAIVQEVYRSFSTARFEARLTQLRTKVLSRKFLFLWKHIAQQRRIQRRVERRRKLMATSAEAKRAKEEELEKILEASREAKRVQLEFRQKAEEKRRQERESQPRQGPTQQNAINGIRHRLPIQVAGQKRKTVASTNSAVNPTSTSVHKRSRTIEHADIDLSSIGKRLSSPLREAKESQSGSKLRKSISHRDLRRSLSGQPLDNTQTDYFRLKAMGVSPDTPLVPDSSRSLAERHSDSLAKRNAALQRLERRRLARSASSQEPFSETSSQPDLQHLRSPELSASIFNTSVTSTSNFDPNEDPFLRQFREARQKMDQDREWFKSQTSLLEKEIEEQEDFQKSLRLSESVADTETSMTAPGHANGLARSTNGLAYTPLNYVPGKTLSRTEQRIRRTGAHGLAVQQPISSHHSSPLYTAHHSPATAEASNHRKRSIDEAQTSEIGHNHRLSATKRPRNDLPHHVINDFTAPPDVQRHPFGSEQQQRTFHDNIQGTEALEEHEQEQDGHAFDGSLSNSPAYMLVNGDQDLPQELEIYEGEEDEEEEQVRGSDEYDGEGEYDYEHGVEGDDDEDEEEDQDEDEEEDDEDEGEYEDEDEDEDIPYSYPQGSLPPSTKLSTPESGPGATFDDAIELSD